MVLLLMRVIGNRHRDGFEVAVSRTHPWLDRVLRGTVEET